KVISRGFEIVSYSYNGKQRTDYGDSHKRCCGLRKSEIPTARGVFGRLLFFWLDLALDQIVDPAPECIGIWRDRGVGIGLLTRPENGGEIFAHLCTRLTQRQMISYVFRDNFVEFAIEE